MNPIASTIIQPKDNINPLHKEIQKYVYIFYTSV